MTIDTAVSMFFQDGPEAEPNGSCRRPSQGLASCLNAAFWGCHGHLLEVALTALSLKLPKRTYAPDTLHTSFCSPLPDSPAGTGLNAP